MSEIKFIKGLYIKKPSENAPSFVIGKGSINVAELLEWQKNNNFGNKYINFDILESQKGTYYAKFDDWKPETQAPGDAQAQEDFNNITSPTADGEPGTDSSLIPF